MPYSVEEMKHPTRDEVIHKEIVIMDNTGSPEFGDFDVHVSLSTEEDVVYISQTHELESRSDLIIPTQHMFQELIESVKKEPGFYNLEWKVNKDG